MPTSQDLIQAAAMDLYKAARAALLVVNNVVPNGSIAADLRAAVCKAEGRDTVSGLTLDAPAAEKSLESPANASDALIRFEVGKEYYARSLCDHACIYRFTVVSRSAKQVVLQDAGLGLRPIRRGISVQYGAETCMPHGNHAMASVLRADRVVPESGDIP